MSEEYTEVLNGVENVIERVLENIANTKKWICICGDSGLPAAHSAVKPVMDAMIDAKRRGVKIRFITKITEDNIPHCRECMEFAELRHLDGIKGNFGISEFVYQATATVPENNFIPQIIVSTSRAIVDQENSIFEMLWNKAISAQEKIREIEEGIQAEFIETIRDPEEMQRLGHRLIGSAQQEVLILFSTANAFHRQESAGLIDLLERKVNENRATSVRILTPMDESIRQSYETSNAGGRFIVKRIEPHSQTLISLSIIDKKYCLSAELRDDTRTTSREAMGLGFHSNSKSTVLSYISIFETLWTQAELYHRLRDVNSQLQHANEILQNHDRLQQEFINIAAHELRTPIQPILGLSQALRESSTHPGQHEFLDAIIRNARRLHILAEEILEVSRIESNLLKLNFQEFDLDRVIHDVIDDIRSEGDGGNLPRNGVRFSIRAEEKMRIRGDRDKICQVISNMVNNALKFTDRTVTVTAKKARNSSKVIVSVKDDGNGIDPDILPRLFTKFASKSNGGTGLGLFICKKIIQAHVGDIWAENNAGRKGAIFWFSIPAGPDRLPGASNNNNDNKAT